ncbi:MAG: leucine-rich repeat protein, partial [Clostridia bacterium]|nr:leucine-rich repeat protein [Clostridia bacterium]
MLWFPPWPSAKVTRAEFDDGIESVGDCAFSLCGDLNSVKLPANLKRIGDYAFVNCVNLKTVTLP